MKKIQSIHFSFAFLCLFVPFSLLVMGCGNNQDAVSEEDVPVLDESFLITRAELQLTFSRPLAERKLSFRNFSGTPEEWKKQTREKLVELLKITEPASCPVKELRKIEFQGVTIHALVMTISDYLTIPGYLLVPPADVERKSAVMAIHGHGSVEPAIGLRDDYHHFFALELAKDGHLVMCPELRGFSTLRDLAFGEEINRLDYWIGGYSQFTLVTDGFLYGNTLIGETVEDLLRWENWFSETYGVQELDVAGISYGGDLCLVYPAFSRRIRRIFASGTLGSFDVIFKRCYNAPAHCIPRILEWMDRSDIAGLSAPSPIAIHFGGLDVPGPDNASASYNETVPQSMEELREIYKTFGAEDAVCLIVTKDKHHEFDIPELLKFFD
jgi:cephalosporin-C deacetylase-like acetyl esterase